MPAQLEKFADQAEAPNAFLMAPLWDLRAVGAMPVIERAFAAGRADESVNGDLEDVQIHFKLKAKREHPPKPNRLTEMSKEFAGMTAELHALEKENADLRELLDALTFGRQPESYLAPPQTGRNEPCPCGSGKKFKKCCGA